MNTLLNVSGIVGWFAILDETDQTIATSVQKIEPNSEIDFVEITSETVLYVKPKAVKYKDKISNMDLRLKLIQIGKTPGQVDSVIDGMENLVQKEIFYTLWNYANTFERLDARLIGIANQLGLTTEQKDELFL